jgi:hydroxymethylcytosylglucuronate/cytosylglucuronate synthase
MEDSVTPAIAVCGVDFGWGSAGKLSAILSATARHGELRTVVLGTKLGRPVLAGANVEAWYEEWPPDVETLRSVLDRHGVIAAVVVLDPAAADWLVKAGIPTVYVDSIPYLWTPADKLPTEVTAYCAQRSPDLPEVATTALDQVARLMWIEAVVAESAARRNGGRRSAVLNFGGLHSPANANGNLHYLALVAPPAIRALADASYDRIEVCGNLTAAELGALALHVASSVRVGPRSHEDFAAALCSADLLLTSPGLTTLLEASAIGIPTLCLPPQNLSQVFNEQRFASIFDPECQVSWPDAMLDLAKLSEVRLSGEEAALRFIDESLAAQDPALTYSQIYRRISQGIRSVVDQTRDWGALAECSGKAGAEQVASLLCQLVTLGEIPASTTIQDDDVVAWCFAHGAP